MQAVALDGRNGAVRWSPFTRALQWGYFVHSVGDLDGDGTDDFVTVTNSAHVLTGATGALQYDNGDFIAYALPMLLDADGDGATDVWVHGGYFADRLLSRTMTTRATRTDHTSPHSLAWGARVTCGGVPAVVAGAYQSPHLWSVRVRDAAPLAHRVLAESAVYPPDMVPAARRTGFVGNVTAVAELRMGGGAAVLVGSTDGYLYALDPCTLDRIWSLDLRYPVGEPIVGDLNGDGADELMVTCADGFLYGVGRAATDAPMEVFDVDPDGLDPLADVDEIDTQDTLYARWQPVAGATSYEVGVFSGAGSEARFPNFRNVGNVTSVSLTMLPLRQGQRYFVSVRPISPGGPGLEGTSDGVVITDRLGPDARVEVIPSRAWPPHSVVPTVVASCRDRVGLSRYRVEIQRPDGGVVRVLEAGDAGGTGRDLRLPWDARDDAGAMVAAGEYRARITCVDLQMRERSADATFTLDPTVMAMVDAGTPSRDAGLDGGRMSSTSAGCACRTVGFSSHSSSALALFALLALAAQRRRARM
jgi:hypothetical protein